MSSFIAMSTDSQKYSDEVEKEGRHSALEVFSRDERRPAVLLLGGLIIAAIFFALGIIFGRWTDKPKGLPSDAPASQQGQKPVANRPSPTPSQTAMPSASTSSPSQAPRR